MLIKDLWPNLDDIIEPISHKLNFKTEDLVSSWQTNEMPTSQRQQNGSNGKVPSTKLSNRELSVSVLDALHSRYNGRSSMKQTELETAQQSMELMRTNIQHLFDDEIQHIVKKYIETYFQPALKNVKENCKNSGITDNYLQKVSCDLLENAKQCFTAVAAVKPEPKTPTLIPATDRIESVPTDELLFTYTLPVKRKEPIEPSTITPNPAPKRTAPNVQIKTITGPKPVVWNIATLTPETLFIFDFKANRALGYFDRERLINQHPELIRYLTDAQDKDWLIQQRLLSPSQRTYRILLFVLDEVSKIAHTDEYRLRPNSKLNELTGFKVPEFMLQKMKNVFMKLSEKNKPITTLHGITMPGTYTITTQPNQMKTIQTMKPILKPQLQASASLSSVLSSMRAGGQTTVLLLDTSGNETQAFLTDTASVARSTLSSSHATLSALLTNSVNDLTSVATITELTDINAV